MQTSCPGTGVPESLHPSICYRPRQNLDVWFLGSTFLLPPLPTAHLHGRHKIRLGKVSFYCGCFTIDTLFLNPWLRPRFVWAAVSKSVDLSFCRCLSLPRIMEAALSTMALRRKSAQMKWGIWEVLILTLSDSVFFSLMIYLSNTSIFLNYLHIKTKTTSQNYLCLGLILHHRVGGAWLCIGRKITK